MKLQAILAYLEEIAPLRLAQEWDNVGLLVGDRRQEVRKVLLTVDLTPAVLAEARRKKTDLLVAYHPPIWEGLKKIVAGEGPAPLLHEVIRCGMAVYALHTALDSVRGGINDLLAEIVGIERPEVLAPAAVESADHYKLVVFCPPADVEKVSEAIFGAGAGRIGQKAQYEKCSFRTRGLGTFQGDTNSHPTIGQPGRFEETEEFRLETVVPAGKLSAVVRAMLQAHSYEEVAYDITPLLDAPRETGLGRFGELKRPVSTADLIETVKTALKVKTAGVIGPVRGRVRRAAVAAGSAGSLLHEVIRQQCDFYLTGELKHHDALQLGAAGVTTVCVGHSPSERVILPRIAKILRRQCPTLTIATSKKDRDPFTWK